MVKIDNSVYYCHSERSVESISHHVVISRERIDWEIHYVSHLWISPYSRNDRKNLRMKFKSLLLIKRRRRRFEITPKTTKISKIESIFSEISNIFVPPFQRGIRRSRDGFNPSVTNDSPRLAGQDSPWKWSTTL